MRQARDVAGCAPSAIDWVETQLGRELRGRLVRYRAIAKQLVAEPSTRLGITDLVSFSDLCCLVDAHRHRESLERDPRLVNRLGEIIGGGLTVWDDAREAKARDFQFELTSAVELLECGAELSREMDHRAVDVECVLSGIRVFVECKRIRTVENFRRRVAEGIEQIERRRSQVDGIGMVFVDASLAASKPGELLSCDTSADVQRIAQPLLSQQAVRLADAIGAIGGRRFGGVVVMNSTQFFVRGEGLVEYRGWIGIDNPRARPAARQVYNQLANQVGERLDRDAATSLQAE